MLGALYFPIGTEEKPIPFDSLFIPYIYREIYFDGVYIDVLNGRKDMTIIDVGSNIGITVNHFRPYAKKVYAIEPSPEHFEALKMNKEYNHWDNVELFNVAMADKDGETTLTQNTMNRTMNTIALGKKIDEKTYTSNIPNAQVLPANQFYENQYTVKTVAFDTFMEQNKIDTVDFCKFDVEGAEDLILRSEGFRKIADRIKAIEIEFHFPSWPQLADYMVSLGYKARRYPCDAIVILFSR